MFVHWQNLSTAAPPVKIDMVSTFSMPTANLIMTEYIQATVTGATTNTFVDVDGLTYTYHIWTGDGSITFSSFPQYQSLELFLVGAGGSGGYIDSQDAASGGGGGGGVVHLKNCVVPTIFVGPSYVYDIVVDTNGAGGIVSGSSAFGQKAGSGGPGGMAVITTYSYDQGNTNGNPGTLSEVRTSATGGNFNNGFITVYASSAGGGGGGCGSYRGTAGSGSYSGGLGAPQTSTIANRAGGAGGGIASVGTAGVSGTGGTGGAGLTFTGIIPTAITAGSGGNGGGTIVGSRSQTTYGGGGSGSLLAGNNTNPTPGVVIVKYKSHA